MRLLIHDFVGHPFQVQLSRELALLGHEVTHTYLEGFPGPKGSLEPLSTDSERLTIVPTRLPKAFQKYSPLRRFSTQREYARQLRKLIAQTDPDVVLSGNTPIDIQAELLWCCHRRGIGFVHWLQDIYCRAIEFFLARKLGVLGALAVPLSFPFRHLEKSVAGRSDAVVVIADAFRDLLLSWGLPESHVNVIENWAPLSEMRQWPRANPWSQVQGLGNETTFIYSGTLGIKHRPDLLYRLAEETLGSSRVVVISEGVGREYLERRPRLDNLTLLDFQPYDRLSEVLAAADVLVATLESDAGQFAVPSKILTYLCAGRPLLLAAPETNLSSAIVRRSGAGEVVDPDNALAWVAAAKRLATDSPYRARLGSSARRYAEAAFDITKVATVFEEILAAAAYSKTFTSTSSVQTTPTNTEAVADTAKGAISHEH
jgi:glycosyltransferase involved in cell wall biosynthesis